MGDLSHSLRGVVRPSFRKSSTHEKVTTKECTRAAGLAPSLSGPKRDRRVAPRTQEETRKRGGGSEAGDEEATAALTPR